MGRPAQTFELKTDLPDRVVSAALRHAEGGSPGVGLLFLSGELGPRALDIAERLRAASTATRWLLVTARGVLTERGELEQQSAAVGMVVPSAHGRVFALDAAGEQLTPELGATLLARPDASAFLFSSTPPERDGWLGDLGRELGPAVARVFGAGTVAGQPIVHVPPHGEPLERTDAAALVLWGIGVPRIAASSACRLLSPLYAVTKTRGAMLLELDEAPALQLLSECAEGLDDHPLILMAVASGDRPLAIDGRSLGLRAILGVDPTQGGLLLPEELPHGTLVGFGVRDAHAARTDLKAHLARLKRESAGTSPAFGFYVNCAGRGQTLYKSSDVDVRLIREQFPNMPLVGLHSSFELAPEEQRLGLRIYCGLLGIYSELS